jgi:hypothetical protein
MMATVQLMEGEIVRRPGHQVPRHQRMAFRMDFHRGLKPQPTLVVTAGDPKRQLTNHNHLQTIAIAGKTNQPTTIGALILMMLRLLEHIFQRLLRLL